MINSFEKIDGGNFGDDLNKSLWDKLLPKPLESYLDENTIFIGIGTRLRPKIIPIDKKIIVFGAGFGYADSPPKVDENWDIRCVRGPLTAIALGIDQKFAITDPAILCKDLYTKGDPIYDVSFIPHHLTLSEDQWEGICSSLKIHYINPKLDPDIVIHDLIHSKLVITESLHGAIIADTFRIPWIAVKTRTYFSEFKWNDWSESMGIRIEYNKLRPLYNKDVRNRSSLSKRFLKLVYGKIFSNFLGKSDLKKLMKQPANLSSQDTFDLKYNQIKDCLNRFILDLEN